MAGKSVSYDLDNNGNISDDEVDKSSQLIEIQLREEKAEAQKLISWVALGAMLIVTAMLFSPVITDSRVAALDNLLGMFYLACASIIGFYFGATAYMSK